MFESDLTRRAFIRRGAAAAAWAATWGVVSARQRSDRDVRAFVLTARESDVAVARSGAWRTWTYDGQVPGPELRVREGDVVRVTLRNQLPQPTTIHWHGVPVPNAMDGVPGVTQAPVEPGESFTYEFVASTPGTYFYHSHSGLQLDRGLYGPLIVEPAGGGAARVDREHIVLLDDWLDITPEEAYAQLQRSRGMGGGMMGGSDPLYAGYLLNGATSAVAPPLQTARGETVRLRLINAASATAFRVGLVGRRLTVTHADGQEVRPVQVDSLIIGMGERYDVTFVADNPDAGPLIAGPVDSVVPGIVVALQYGGALVPTRAVPVWPSALLRGRALRYADLQPVAATPPGASPIPQIIPLTLGSAMMGGYVWTINGQAYPNADAIRLESGRPVRLRIVNGTMMRHPMHLHGHFFTLRQAAAASGSAPLKDTALVDAMGSVDLEFETDNPGRWLFHCHHAYHMEAGMARVLEY